MLSETAGLMNLARTHAQGGEMEKALPLIEEAYRVDPACTDLYVRCAWHCYWPRKEFRRLAEWAEKDRIAGRISPAFLLNLAQAYAAGGEVDKAWPLVGEAYAKNPSLVDGYAKCAWHFHWPRREYETLVEWMEKDRWAGKLSPAWSIHLAQAYAAGGEIDKAGPLIGQAYAKDPLLVDGYAQCAWQVYWPSRNVEPLISWMEKDRRTKRLSPAWTIHLAEARAAGGDFDGARALVEEAYAAAPSLVDGYAKCAWFFFWPRKEYEPLIAWMEKDRQANRMSSALRLNLAQAYSAADQMEEAFRLVETAYAENPNLHDGYARCAWPHFWPKWPRREYARIAGWMERDLGAGKMSPEWLLKLAQVYAADRRFEAALPLVEAAYVADASLKDGYIKCAWQHFWPKWPRPEWRPMIEWMERDLRAGRISSSGYLSLSQAYAADREYEKAIAMVALA